MRRPVRPCIDRLPDGTGCPEYALPGKSRCGEHQAEALKTRRRSPGTTAAWRKAREQALARTGCCEQCGRSEAAARAAGTWLEVHHVDGRGVRAQEHDQAQLQVLCRQPCHLDTLRQKTRPTLEEHRAGIRARVEAQRAGD